MASHVRMTKAMKPSYIKAIIKLIMIALLLSGCEAAKEQQEKASSAAQEQAENTKEGAQELAERTQEGARELTDRGKEGLGELTAKGGALVDYPEIDTGGAIAWLKRSPSLVETGVEALVVKGAAASPLVAELSSLVREAYDSDTTIMPIYQKLDDEQAQQELDEAIADMPKTEEIQGVQVGYKSLDDIDQGKSTKERSYLVLWRHDDHLVGFVYRSRREVDLDEIARRTPAILALIEAAL